MTRRRSSKTEERDARVEEAIAALNRGEFLNINRAAKHFKLNYGTLKSRMDGGKSIAESRAPYQNFTIAEENALAQ
jgi:hypothetical protein